jgi:hypothetical protein
VVPAGCMNICETVYLVGDYPRGRTWGLAEDRPGELHMLAMVEHRLSPRAFGMRHVKASHASWGADLTFKAGPTDAEPKKVPASASFKVPYWPAFAATAALAPLGIVLVALWIDDLAHLMVGGPALAVTVTQLTLIMALGAIVAARFEYLTLYHLELRASQVIGRSTLKSWTFSLSDIEAIVPGWVRPWWSADHDRYVVKFADGPRLFIWSGKGLNEFLDCVGAAEPRIRLGQTERPNRAERSRGRSGFCGD